MNFKQFLCYFGSFVLPYTFLVIFYPEVERTPFVLIAMLSAYIGGMTAGMFCSGRVDPAEETDEAPLNLELGEGVRVTIEQVGVPPESEVL